MAENRIDTQLPGAPELAAYGEFEIGTQPIDLVNPGQLDVDEAGNPTEESTLWTGFAPRTAKGLRWEWRRAGE